MDKHPASWLPLPADEGTRLARLHALRVLDTEPEALFDTLALAASTTCGVPVGMINLVEADQQWTKAWAGAGESLGRVPRLHAFCPHLLDEYGVMEVRDATQDARFAASPLVCGAAGIRFYAGAAIRLSDGHAVGALCVIDHRPGELDERQRGTLAQLAAAAAHALEMREQALAALAENEAGRQRLQHVYDHTPAMLHCVDADSRIVNVSDLWLARLGYRREEVLGRCSRDFLAPVSNHRVEQIAGPQLLRDGHVDRLPLQLVRRDGSLLDVEASSVLERDADGALLRTIAVLEDTSARHAAEHHGSVAEERYRALVDDQVDMVCVTRMDGTLSFVNAAYARFFGLRPADLIGRNLFELLPPADRDHVIAEIRATRERRGEVEGEDMQVGYGDQARWFAWTNRVIGDPDNPEREVHSVGRDTTARRLAERRLAESRELLQVTLDSIGDAVVTTDTAGIVQWLNPVAERLTGWPKADAAGRALTEVCQLVGEEGQPAARQVVAECLASGQPVGRTQDSVLVSRDGSRYGVTNAASPIRDAGGALLGAVLVFHDSTEQRRLTRELSHRAVHDALTGLVNRAEFEGRLGRLLARIDPHATPAANGAPDGEHALLYIDLDQFKIVNDACGHSAGDQLLRQVSGLLQACVRGRDTVARLGGDEFGVLLEHCGVEHAQRAARDICDRMDAFRFVHDDGRRFRVGASIGLVPLDGRGLASAAAVLQAADTACYAAKEAGRNRLHVWFDTDEAMRARHGQMQWATRIEQALDEDGFVLYAQRIEPVDRATAGLHCELLVRLREADGTLVSPGAFLPAAERFHLASRIDRWVVRHAFHWLTGLGAAAAGVELIAVNLSGQSIGDSAFRHDVIELCRGATFDVRKLCFEITETAAITNFVEARGFVEDMRALGVKIALDDFGAGASSFGYLKTLPVDFLKIDGQFITDLLEDPLDDAAVRCFCEVAKLLGVKTVAEFVERDDVLQRLCRIGVDYAQGYLLHRPQALHGLPIAVAADA